MNRLSIPGRRSRWRAGVPIACSVAVTLALALSPVAAYAQQPPDSLAADSLPAAAPPDTVAGDSLAAAVPDTVFADTVYYNLPAVGGLGPAGWAQGVWVWDHEAILVTGASTLAELTATVPGLVSILAGDYGTPVALTAFGVTGGRVRVIRDGFEVLPLEGGVTDLARVGLGGIESVRLERNLGELVLRLESRTHDDARPFSLVEAGTGDLATNFFRGTFVDPGALGGSVGLALERADTRGRGGTENGNRTGFWLRYQLHRGDAAGLAFELRRMGTETLVPLYAGEVTRTDWTIRGRVLLTEGLVAEAYGGQSRHKMGDTREAYAREGGTRAQLGGRLAWERSGLFGRAEYRRFGGEALPGDRLDLSIGAAAAQLGGIAADFDRAGWRDETTSAHRVRAWTRQVLGLSLFASQESGIYGARSEPPRDVEPAVDPTDEEPPEPDPVPPLPAYRVSDRSARRIGAQLERWGMSLSGAALRLEADSLLPIGLEPDREALPVVGGKRWGWEARGYVPTPLDGLALEGSLQQWSDPWPYLPERVYHAGLVFHREFLATGNFELWWSLGVRGHDPMVVRLSPAEGAEETLVEVPFFQSWYGRIQARILTVRIFINWENLSVRRNLQDYPGRLLPVTRTTYGIRWDLWG